MEENATFEDTIYGNDDSGQELIFPRAGQEAEGVVDRTHLKDLALFLRNKVVDETQMSGRSDFVKALSFYSSHLKKLGGMIDPKVTGALDRLASEASAVITREDYENLREKTRCYLRECKLGKR